MLACLTFHRGAHPGRNDETDHRSASTIEKRRSSDRYSVMSITRSRVGGKTHPRAASRLLMSFLIFHVWMFCSASLLISTECTNEKLEDACSGDETCAGKGREQGGWPLSCVFLHFSNLPNSFIEGAEMTRKRKRDSEPSETAPDATGSAQPAQIDQSGQALEEKTGPDMNIGVMGAQTNAHDMVSAAKKRSKPKKKNTLGRGPLAPKPKIIKLKPARPYPTVPISSSATVPRSRRAEGLNMVCVTRRTDLGSYLRQCRDILTKDGYVHVR